MVFLEETGISVGRENENGGVRGYMPLLHFNGVGGGDINDEV